jgi:hypothetical protein
MMPCKEASCYPPSKNSTMPDRGCDVIHRALSGETAPMGPALARAAHNPPHLKINLDFRLM